MNRSTALKAIEKRLAKGTTPYPEKPDALPLSEISTFEPLFQTRDPSADESATHVRKLRRNIQRKGGEPLDPIQVFWIGRVWCCIDGHHRLQAYKEAIKAGHWKEAQPVPVEVFVGSLLEACAAGLHENGKDRLPMRESERDDAAWGFVILDAGQHHSKKETAEKTGVSTATIGNMRRVLAYFQEEHPAQNPAEFRWFQARQFEKHGEESEPGDSEKRRQETVERYARLLHKHFKDDFMRDASLLVEVVREAYSTDFLPALSAAIESARDEDSDGL